MNVEKSFFNFGNKITPQKTKNNEADLSDVEKNTVKKLLKRAEREVCEWGNFSDVIEEFKNPNDGQDYKIFISPSPNKEKPDVRILQLAAQLPHTDRMFSVDIKRGTKKDILNYLSESKNLGEILGYTNMLSERLGKE